MDGQSREDLERRLIEDTTVIERCDCQKTGKKKIVIRGYAALFNSDSHDLGGFVERVLPGAFDNVLKRGTDVVALYNHEPMFLLGRESAGTLRLSVDERGLRYEIDAPESRADVVEAIERGDVRGSSFAFKVKGQGERWSRMQDGRQLREIVDFDGLFDVGPVLRPAYPATETFVSQRALQIARAENRGFAAGDFVSWEGGAGRVESVDGDTVNVRVWINEEDLWEETDDLVQRNASSIQPGEQPAQKDEAPTLKPTAGMAGAAKRGLQMHAETNAETPPEVIARANMIAKRDPLTETHVRGMNAWFSAAEQRDELSFMLHGGTPGKNWAARAMKSFEGRDMDEEPGESLSPANFALYEAIEKIVVEEGQWPQSGPGGAHYMPESPFAKGGMRCENCVSWNEGGSCDVVEGEIAPAGLCKLWVIPEERLQAAERSIDPASEAARLKAKSLETAARGLPH